MQGAFFTKAFWYVDFFYLFNWIGSVLRWTEDGSFYRCILYLFCNVRAIHGSQYLFSWLVFFIGKIIIPFPALREGHIAENQVSYNSIHHWMSKISCIPGDWLSQKTSLGVLLCTAQGQFWGPVSPETAPEPPSTQRLQTLFAHIKLLLAVFYCI